MAKLERCPLCPLSTRPGLLIGGLCDHHRENGGELHKVPDNVSVQVVKAPVIEKQSETMKQQMRQYLKLKDLFIEANPYCLARLQGCTGRATDIHHRAGRIGNNLLNVHKFLPVCRSCHDFITADSSTAIELGLSERRNTAV